MRLGSKPTKSSSPGWWLSIWACGWLLVAIFLYQPFQPRPFDVLDFSEFVPILEANTSWASRTADLSSYYATQGRASLVGYAMLAAKWSLWGDAPVAWQVVRLLQMSAVAVLLYLFLRRVGATILGAAAATTLPLAARVSEPAWMRLNMAEPLGTILILAALLAATRYRDTARPGASLLFISGVVLVLAFLKEIILTLLPAVWFLSITTGSESWRIVAPTRRHALLFVATGGVALISAIVVLLVARGGSATAYATLYGSQAINYDQAWISYITFFIPFVPVASPFHPGVLFANLAFTSLLIGGLRHHAEWSRRTGGVSSALVLFGLLVPALGAAAYLPWPVFQAFYGLPFLVGVATLVAFAVTGVELEGGRAKALGLSCWAIVVLYMTVNAHGAARRDQASLRLSNAATNHLGAFADHDSVFFAVRYLPLREWFGIGQTHQRSLINSGSEAPAVRDVLCADAAKAIQEATRPGVFFVFQSHCGSLGRSLTHTTLRFRRFDWYEFAVVPDSARLDIVVPTQVP